MSIGRSPETSSPAIDFQTLPFYVKGITALKEAHAVNVLALIDASHTQKRGCRPLAGAISTWLRVHAKDVFDGCKHPPSISASAMGEAAVGARTQTRIKGGAEQRERLGLGQHVLPIIPSCVQRTTALPSDHALLSDCSTGGGASVPRLFL